MTGPELSDPAATLPRMTADDADLPFPADEVADPDDRCAAATASPLDRSRRCPVHPDGAHHCYRGPGHQHANRTGPVTEPHAGQEWIVPEWARHWCDCGFAWADIVQPRGPRADGQTGAQRYMMQLRVADGAITLREIEHG